MSPIATLGQPFDKMRGTLHNSTAQVLSIYDSPGNGTVVRALKAKSDPALAGQVAIRNNFRTLVTAFRALDAATAAAWNAVAAAITYTNRLGQPYNPTGCQLFVAVNTYRILCAHSTTTSPPSSTATPTITQASIHPTPVPSNPSLVLLHADATGYPAAETPLAFWRLAQPVPGRNLKLLPHDYHLVQPLPAAQPYTHWPSNDPHGTALIATVATHDTNDVLHLQARSLSEDFVPAPGFTYHAPTITPYESEWFACCDNAATSTIRDHGTAAHNAVLYRSGTPRATSLNSVAGLFGRALTFNGTTDYAKICSTPTDAAWLAALTASECNFTLALWFRPHYQNASMWPFALVSYDGPLKGALFALTNGTANGTLHVYVNTVGTAGQGYIYPIPGLSPQSAWDNVWFHIALTRQTTTYTCYLNGVSGQTSTPTNGDMPWFVTSGAQHSFTLGGYITTGATPSFYGSCDVQDIRCFNRALGPTEIAALYASGAGYPYSLATTPP